MPGAFTTKSLDAILQDLQSAKLTLRRALGPVQITLLGIGAIIGAGIFATIGTAAAGDAQRLGAGPGLMLSFVLSAGVCALVALCYAEFASMVPISGSAYTYSYATLGELIAWIIGWDLIIEYAVGNVAVAISWANYFKTLMRGAGVIIPDWLSTDFQTAHKIPGLIESAPHLLGVPLVFNLLAFLIVAAVTVVLLIGIRQSAWFNAGMVILKLAVLGFFIFLGVRYLQVDNWQPFLPNGWQGLASGAAVIFFAYIGFDAVSTVAEEANRPQRDLPLGIIASLVICTVIYIIVAAVFTGMIPFPALTQMLSTQQAEPLTLALEYAHAGGLAVLIVALGSVIAHTAVLFVFQLGQPRIFFSMARDGLLPGVFAKIHPRYRTPWGSTILTGLAVGTAAMFTSLDEMVDLTNIGTLFAFTLVCVGIIILRVRDPERPRPFRAPGGLVLPVLGALGCLGLIYYLPPTSWLRFSAWLNFGAVLYVSYGSTRSRLTGRATEADPARHDARTAGTGAWLGVFGTGLLIAARLADVYRLGGEAPEGWWAENSWWLTVPLLLNLVILYPTVLTRAWRARRSDLPAAERIQAGRALWTAGIMAALTAGYLGLVVGGW
ncbi:MAG: amino acid permease [Candidatus Zixiibacteriota bacterium]|nr:MAG: amino acid permease [candidate division Zixibacteria bacterium]